MPSMLKRERSFLDKSAFNFPSFTTKGLFENLEHDLIATAGEFIGTVCIVKWLGLTVQVLFLLVSLGVSILLHGARAMARRATHASSANNQAVQNVNNVMQQFGESKDTAPSPAAQIIVSLAGTGTTTGY